jgi:hypothetical protein
MGDLLGHIDHTRDVGLDRQFDLPRRPPAGPPHHACTMQCIHAGPTTGLKSGLE